jgi:hypothetical protein
MTSPSCSVTAPLIIIKIKAYSSFYSNSWCFYYVLFKIYDCKYLTKPVIQVKLVIKSSKILQWRGNPRRLHPNPFPMKKKSFCRHITTVHHHGAKARERADGLGNKEVGVDRVQLPIVGRVIVGRAVMAAMIGGKGTTAHNHTGMMRMHSRNGLLKGRTTANSRRLTNAEGVALIHGGDEIANDGARESGGGLKKIWKILRLGGQKNIQGFR